jgi:hypothetical protein
MSNGPIRPGDRSAVLVSASCTTGWADWVHGELWLLDDGLARFSLGLLTTMNHAEGHGWQATGVTREFSLEDIDLLVHATKRNLFIPRGVIARADLRGGLITGRLRLELDDGTTRKLLWMRSSKATALLAPRLREWLGDGLTEA